MCNKTLSLILCLSPGVHEDDGSQQLAALERLVPHVLPLPLNFSLFRHSAALYSGELVLHIITYHYIIHIPAHSVVATCLKRVIIINSRACVICTYTTDWPSRRKMLCNMSGESLKNVTASEK